MRKLRVGVWLYKETDPQTGGLHSYYSRLVNAINKHTFNNAEIVFLTNHPQEEIFHPLYRIKWKKKQLLYLIASIIRIYKLKFLSARLANFVFSLENNHNLKLINELINKVDIIYYSLPSCVYPIFPYIYTIWDLGYISTYSFPEFTTDDVFLQRKAYYDNIAFKALMVFAESHSGKKDLIKYLRINESRVKVVPIFPSIVITDQVIPTKPKNLPNELFFVHYPAQFWAHKNHYNLLIALKEILNIYPNLKLVLTGSDKFNKSYILQTIQILKLNNNVFDLDFVTIEDLKWLYLNSQGLVMPTFLGPTNIPLLEAAELGCSVACSYLPGHIEQLGTYGYYFDPLNPRSIADQIIKMIEDKINGVIKSYESKFNIAEALIAIDKSFDEIRNVRLCWNV